MTTRIYVRVDVNGIVDQDLEVARRSFSRVELPSNMVDITGHKQWRGSGSLIGWKLLPDGRFEPPATP